MNTEVIDHYLDEQGRVMRWPAKRHRDDRAPLLNYFASKFEAGKIYNEREVNEVLKQYHTFEDWALLRRELCEQGYLKRNRSGSQYWLVAQTVDDYTPGGY